MVSVPLAADRLLPWLPPELSIAANNGPELCVVSGPAEAVQKFADDSSKKGIECQRLRIAVAAHSAMLDSFLDEFLRVIRSISLHAPELPFISNVTGTWITDEAATNPQYWVDHLRSTVQFASGISTLLASESRILLEVGPGTALSSIAKLQTGTGAPERALSTLGRASDSSTPHESLLTAAGQLWVAGVRFGAGGMFAHQRRLRVPLPTYPFEHERHWIDATALRSVAESEPPEATDRHIASWLQVPVWERSALHRPDPDRLKQTRWLIFTDGGALGQSVVALLAGAADISMLVEPGPAFEAHVDGRYTINPTNAADYESVFADLRTRRASPTHILYLWAVGTGSGQESIADDLDATEQNAFYDLLHLAKAVGVEGSDAPIELGVVSAGLQPVGKTGQFSRRMPMRLGGKP
jgi:acyl transferase domain-containing protein